jgi:hypothetical protein
MKSLFPLILASTACGAPCANSATLAEYQQASQAVSSSVAQHRTNTRTTTNRSECNHEYQRYRGDIIPKARSLRTLAGHIDSCAAKGERSLDVAMCDEMMNELDRYYRTACQSDDNRENLREAERHCDAMDHDIGTAAASMTGNDRKGPVACLPLSGVENASSQAQRLLE